MWYQFQRQNGNACGATQKCYIEKGNGNIVGVEKEEITHKGKCRLSMFVGSWLVARALQRVCWKYLGRVNINMNICMCRIRAEYVVKYVQCLGDGYVGSVKHGTLGASDWTASVYP